VQINKACLKDLLNFLYIIPPLQLTLARADADGEITARRARVFFPDTVAGQIIDLGPFADGIGLFSVEFPMIFGQRAAMHWDSGGLMSAEIA
jgi:hypothetical protein